MTILAIDTTTHACSCAISIDGKIIEDFKVVPQQHGKHLLASIDQLLNSNGLNKRDLTAIAVTNGPGSFTGLRIGAGVAQGLAMALALPVIPVSTLQVMAQGAVRLYNSSDILVAMDARMHEVYWGEYSLGANGIMQEQVADQVIAPAGCMPSQTKAWLRCGNGWKQYEQLFPDECLKLEYAELDYPHAYDLLEIANNLFIEQCITKPDQLKLKYLRDKVAHKPNK